MCSARCRARDAGDGAGPERLFWSLWAAKSAYKLFTKLGVVPSFAHQELEVAADLRSVASKGAGSRFELISGRRLRARPPGPRPWRCPRQSGAGGDPSRGARRLLADLVASMTECASAELAVEQQPCPAAGTASGRLRSRAPGLSWTWT
ncbi:MAG: hypothetical protein U0263_41540 [Polyangiaceae bacterium]